MQRTYMMKPDEIRRDWYVVDAENMILGRLASDVAKLLRGKHKAEFTPHLDCGDHVIVINASKVQLTGNKWTNKIYYRHTNYPGGLKELQYKDFLAKQPERVIEKAVRGMLPKNRLGRQMFRKLKVYAGPDHPHEAQKPKPLQLPKAAAERKE